MAAIDHGHGVALTAEQARGGKELGSVRWVLRASLALAVVAGLVIYFSFFRL